MTDKSAVAIARAARRTQEEQVDRVGDGTRNQTKNQGNMNTTHLDIMAWVALRRRSNPPPFAWPPWLSLPDMTSAGFAIVAQRWDTVVCLIAPASAVAGKFE